MSAQLRKVFLQVKLAAKHSSPFAVSRAIVWAWTGSLLPLLCPCIAWQELHVHINHLAWSPLPLLFDCHVQCLYRLTMITTCTLFHRFKEYVAQHPSADFMGEEERLDILARLRSKKEAAAAEAAAAAAAAAAAEQLRQAKEAAIAAASAPVEAMPDAAPDASALAVDPIASASALPTSAADAVATLAATVTGAVQDAAVHDTDMGLVAPAMVQDAVMADVAVSALEPAAASYDAPPTPPSQDVAIVSDAGAVAAPSAEAAAAHIATAQALPTGSAEPVAIPMVVDIALDVPVAPVAPVAEMQPPIAVPEVTVADFEIKVQWFLGQEAVFKVRRSCLAARHNLLETCPGTLRVWFAMPAHLLFCECQKA